MIKTLPLMLAALLICFCSLSAEESKAVIDFNGVSPDQALDVYARLSGLQLITDSHLKSVHTPIFLHNSKLSSSEMMISIEKALIEQAGIVITRLDDNRVSVIYNDALPITKVK